MDNLYNILLNVNDSELFRRHYKTIGYACGSSIAEICTSPLFAIKTNYQTSKENKTYAQIVREMYKARGIFGFYGAVFSAVLARVLSAFIKYAIYNEIKYYYSNEDNDVFANMAIGCFVGVSSSVFIHPVDVITNHMQRFKKLNGDVFQIKVLYSGFSQTVIRNLVLYSILFPVFDYCKYLTNNDILLACIMTTSVSSTILQPVEYLRTRWMAQQKGDTGSILNSFKNFKSCWKGYRINYIANTAHFSISMCIANYLSQKYN
jgi:hypothetical protein